MDQWKQTMIGICTYNRDIRANGFIGITFNGMNHKAKLQSYHK